MSGPRLSRGAQVRYLVQWFEEWSELQRGDFLPLLLERLAPGVSRAALDERFAALNCHDKPMSLFQCRIKLFNEWYPTWGEEERERLVQSITNIDPEFGSKLQQEIEAASRPEAALSNGVHSDEETPHDQLESPAADSDEAEKESETREDAEEIVQETVQENVMPLEIAATS